MEVLLGHTLTIDVPSSPPHSPPEYGGDPATIDEAGERDASTSFSGDGSGFRVGGQPGFFFGDSSESSSSIGTPDDSDDEKGDDVSSQKEEEEAQSTLKVLGSLDSLQDSLPIKRGLSSHFSGKSKSFTDVSQVSSVKDLQKQENPLNKRRRVQIASKWSRRSSFYAYSNPKSMPLLPLNEDSEPEEEEEEKEEETDREVSPSPPASSSILAEEKKPRDEVNRVPRSYAVRMRQKLGSFQSRSLSLADLQEHDEEEKDDDD